MTVTERIHRVGVVGCGLMGSGIAEVSARARLDVVVVEITDETLRAGRRRLETSLARAVRAGKLSLEQQDAALTGCRFTTEYDELADRQLVVEAVIESEGMKMTVFRPSTASWRTRRPSWRQTPPRSRS